MEMRSHADDLAPQASEEAPRPNAAVAAIVNVAVMALRAMVRMRVPCLLMVHLDQLADVLSQHAQ